MLRKRIIPKFLIKGGRLVKGVQFNRGMREAGNPTTTARVYNDYGVDELIILDIEATAKNRKTEIGIVDKISKEIFMPFTVGGGVRSIEDINSLLKSGADKIALTTAAVENPSLIKEAAKKFGNQCLVAGIDYREIAPGVSRVFTHGGHKLTKLDPYDLALTLQENNCGEIMLCAIDHDGMMNGYDLEMIARLSEKLDIPLIASCGAGNLEDCYHAFEKGAAAITVSSMFLFTDNSPIKLRSYLFSKGINVRASKNSRN